MKKYKNKLLLGLILLSANLFAQISSINSLLNAATPFPLLTPEQQEYKRTEIITAAEDKYYGTNYSALEKLFLQKYGSLGLNLSRANDALTNFDKLSLDINNNVIENPCN
jgi:hypothetical protein